MAKDKFLEKLLKLSSIENCTTLDKSELYDEVFFKTPIPCLNLFLSGKFSEGMQEGRHIALSGGHSSFKTVIMLILIRSYFAKYKDAKAIIYDSEGGYNKEYVKNFGLDPSRIIPKKFATLEMLRSDLVKTLEGIERGEHLIVGIDSISMSGSKKELEDVLEDNEKKDLTRNQVIKSLFRLATPLADIKNIPLISINHNYSTIDPRKPTAISGGGGVHYSASFTWEMTKLKGEEVEVEGVKVGSTNFRVKIFKSRKVKEAMSFLLTVPKSGSMQKYSGLYELACEFGYINNGAWVEVPCLSSYEGKKVRRKEIENDDEFWNQIFTETDFVEQIEKSVKASEDQSKIFDDIEEEYQEAINNSKEVFEEDETE